MLDIEPVVRAILACRASITSRAPLIGVSGIDACAKGFVARQLVNQLMGRGVRAVGINVDGWLSLPQDRFSDTEQAQRFYDRAIRFEEMFARLVLPLREPDERRRFQAVPHRTELRVTVDASV